MVGGTAPNVSSVVSSPVNVSKKTIYEKCLEKEFVDISNSMLSSRKQSHLKVQENLERANKKKVK